MELGGWGQGEMSEVMGNGGVKGGECERNRIMGSEWDRGRRVGLGPVRYKLKGWGV